MWFLKFCILTFLFINVCNFEEINILDKVITNSIKFFDRQNRILVAVSEGCKNETYQTLIQGFGKLEDESREKNITLNEWTTAVSFGGKENRTLDKQIGIWLITECKYCYEISKVNNVSKTALEFVPKNEPCDPIPSKEFNLIISDQCLPELNLQLNNQLNCPKEYRNIGLLLPTIEDLLKCEAILKEYANATSSKIYLQLFASDLRLNETELYSNMDVIYHSTLATTVINFLMIAQKDYSVPFAGLRCKYEKFQLCTDGSIIAYFQFLKNESHQDVATISLPWDFEHADYFMSNFNNLLSHFSSQKLNCSFIRTFLIEANARPLNNAEQYNVLILEDPYPECLDFDWKWNNTNRHLEIIVMYKDQIKSDYWNFIDFSNNSLNHINFYEKDGFSYCEYNTICRKTVKTKNLTDPILIRQSESAIFEFDVTILFMIVGGIILITAVVMFIMYLVEKNKEESERHNFIGEIAESIIFEEKTLKDGHFWKWLLNDTDIILEKEMILGKGPNSTVYRGWILYIIILGTFRSGKPLLYLSATKIAAKTSSTSTVNIKDNDFMVELNALIILKNHTNIVSLIGWTIKDEIPFLITELAESNLLDFVQAFLPQNSPIKIFLQILWQILNALEYLSENGIIHRDVAARNILIFDKNVAKLCDFCLCCKTDKSGIFKDLTHKKFPVKWLSIEAIKNREFSEKSDVWAFGILCFEVFSNGGIPYSEILNDDLPKFLEDGNRLPKLINTPTFIYDLMLLCWKKDPKDRINLKEMKKKLVILLEYSYLPLSKY